MSRPEIISDGDIFRSRAQTLVNTVNCVGVMGKGIALGFRRRFPAMHDDYVQRCGRGEVHLGRPYLYRQVDGPWVLNFPTKDHWRSMSRLVDIEAGLEHLLENYEDWGITSLAMPPLGAGHGGLEWHVVGPTLYAYISRMGIPVELYVPYGTRHEELQPQHLQQTLTGDPTTTFGRIGPEWVALLEVISRLEQEQYRPTIGRVLFQKLAYFGTAAGLDLDLRFSRGSFGPFSPELKKHISHLTNNGLIVEARRGNLFEVKLGPTYRAAERAVEPELRRYTNVVGRLVDLFSRMRTRDAEIAATVHFVWTELSSGGGPPPSEEDVVEAVVEWKRKRNPPIARSDVAEATRNLNLLGWIGATPSAGVDADPDLKLLSA